ncbi:MAG: CBS domain-containing protein [Candidatus Bathyarchaeota archaeon]|jgi:signal-transduction protein with cAMP-binding, CBS, and nucleotidyltransferase domain|nr:CBS domain-containing protein [Candidatus Bathyarchaeota archaeon]
MSLELEPKMMVREAMSSPVFAVEESSNITEVAMLMKKQKLGAIVINNSDGQPIGIVTERDIVHRVVADGKSPHEVKANEVMSSPLRVVKAETPIVDAMRMMDKLNIRRLGVTYKGQLVGIISHKDIIRIIPTIMEIMRENSKINGDSNSFSPSTIGYCDRCEMHSTNLRAVDGEFLCEDCRAEEKEE